MRETVICPSTAYHHFAHFPTSRLCLLYALSFPYAPCLSLRFAFRAMFPHCVLNFVGFVLLFVDLAHHARRFSARSHAHIPVLVAAMRQRQR